MMKHVRMPFLNEPQGSLAVWQILSLMEAEPMVELASAVVVRHTAEKFRSQHRAVMPVCLASHAAANAREPEVPGCARTPIQSVQAPSPAACAILH
jgi:hypothetical protein